jgi:predicted MPP superfamily phosphohydrolase
MRVFLQALIGQILVNVYIMWSGRRMLPHGKKWHIPFVSLIVAEWILYFFGYFFHRVLPEQVMAHILLICNTWYIASAYLAIGFLLLEIVRWAGRRFSVLRNCWRQVKFPLFLLMIAGVSLLMMQARRNALDPVVKHVYLHIPKAAEGRDSLKVALMSDLHFGEYIGKKQAQRFVARCNGQHPDIVAIAGDVIDYESLIPEQMRIEDDLRQLKAPLGVYYTLGNHEYRANRHAKLRWIRKTGGTLLVDSVAMPDSTFYLVGRDDAVNPARAALHTLMKTADRSKPVIVLDHQPTTLFEVAMNGADLGLYGHTHNGQLWPYSLALKLLSIYECVYGYCRKGNTHFYVSSGLGCAGAPYRVGTHSELVILHLTFDRPAE